jgi:hypothetical protein
LDDVVSGGDHKSRREGQSNNGGHIVPIASNGGKPGEVSIILKVKPTKQGGAEEARP